MKIDQWISENSLLVPTLSIQERYQDKLRKSPWTKNHKSFFILFENSRTIMKFHAGRISIRLNATRILPKTERYGFATLFQNILFTHWTPFNGCRSMNNHSLWNSRVWDSYHSGARDGFTGRSAEEVCCPSPFYYHYYGVMLQITVTLTYLWWTMVCLCERKQ